VLEALDRGCHVYCDKPLSATSAEAKTLYAKSRDAGVKTAFAASFRYQPHALLARELVKEGAIGEPWEVECVSHYNLNPLIPFGWSHRINQGGGRLNNNFTHKLSIALHVLNGEVVAAKGEARNDMPKAPVVGGVHDFRIRERYAPTRAEISESPDRWSWADADAEWSYTVLAQIESEYVSRQPMSALFRHGGLLPRFYGDYVAFHGSEGAIHIEGSYAQGPLHIRANDGQWSPVPMRRSIIDAIPAIDDDTQRNWTQLAREFVADIMGLGYSGYQTFRDGWVFQEVIDAVRSGGGWTRIDQVTGQEVGRSGTRPGK
jgi:predicted dehydrogenase